MKSKSQNQGLSVFLATAGTAVFLTGCPTVSSISSSSSSNSSGSSNTSSNNAFGLATAPSSTNAPTLLFQASSLSLADGATIGTWTDTSGNASGGGLIPFQNNSASFMANVGVNDLASSVPSAGVPSFTRGLASTSFRNSCLVSTSDSKFPTNSDYTAVMVVRPGTAQYEVLLGDGNNNGEAPNPPFAGADGRHELYFFHFSGQTIPSVAANSLTNIVNEPANAVRLHYQNYWGQASTPTQLAGTSPSGTNGYNQNGGVSDAVIPWGQYIVSRDYLPVQYYYTVIFRSQVLTRDSTGAPTSTSDSLYVNGINETALQYNVCYSSGACPSYMDTYSNDPVTGRPTNTLLTSLTSVPATASGVLPSLASPAPARGSVAITSSAYTVGCNGADPLGTKQFLGHDSAVTATSNGAAQIAEVQIYNRALSDSDRAALEAQLATKYGHYIPSVNYALPTQ